MHWHPSFYVAPVHGCWLTDAVWGCRAQLGLIAAVYLIKTWEDPTGASAREDTATIYRFEHRYTHLHIQGRARKTRNQVLSLCLWRPGASSRLYGRTWEHICLLLMCTSRHVSDSFRGVARPTHKFLTVRLIASLQMRQWRHLASHVEIPQGLKISSGELSLICQTARGWDKETPRVVTLTRHVTTMFANSSTGFVFICLVIICLA